MYNEVKSKNSQMNKSSEANNSGILVGQSIDRVLIIHHVQSTKRH